MYPYKMYSYKIYSYEMHSNKMYCYKSVRLFETLVEIPRMMVWFLYSNGILLGYLMLKLSLSRVELPFNP